MKILYFWDAYCGWCYGFDAIFKDFYVNHTDIPLEMISGGLFVGDRVKNIGDFTHFKQANQQISDIYGVTFGEGYQASMNSRAFDLDSSGPATAFAILRDKITPQHLADLAYAIQEQFFIHGKDLSDATTYGPVAQSFNLDPDQMIQEITEAMQTSDLAHDDFIKTYQMGIQSYPTVVLQINDQYYDLRGNATTVEQLETIFSRIIEVSQS
ncbi:TPA: DsbA family protein [Streptococcus suis]